MSKAKSLTFNLCDYDEFHLSFVNRKGACVYSIYFLRICAASNIAAGRKVYKENPEAREQLFFRHYARKPSVAIEFTEVTRRFQAKHAPRKSTSKDAVTHEQTIKLAGFSYKRPLEVHIVGKDGLSLGTFLYKRATDQAQFNVNHADGSGHGFTFYPPEKEFKQEVKAND